MGHIMRMVALENIVMTENMSAKKGRGRPKEIMLNGGRQWHGEVSSKELIWNSTETKISDEQWVLHHLQDT